MRKILKKGFTVVELVIAVAVVAIITAVLVPVISSAKNEARKSADTLIISLNSALKEYEQSNGSAPKTMRDALDVVSAQGYDVAKISSAKSNDGKILWDSVNDVFVRLKDGKVEYLSQDVKKSKMQSGYRLWAIASEPSDTYSTYLYKATKKSFAGVKTGIDVGNEDITSIEYVGGASAQDVVIYTNGGALTINDTKAKSHQYHYGVSASVTVATGNNCYEGHAVVGAMTITQGKVIADTGAYIGVVNAASGVTLQEKYNGVFVVPASVTSNAVAPAVVATLGYNVTAEGTTASLDRQGKLNSSFVKISNAEELSAFRDAVNSGLTYAGLTVKLVADIDLSSVTDWAPIGLYKNEDGSSASNKVFSGTFDGQGHTISGLTINSEYKFRALFGKIDGANLKNFTVKGTVVADEAAGVVGYAANSTIDGVTSYVDVDAESYAGGIVAYVGAGDNSIENCVNYGSISVNAKTAKDSSVGAAGGIIGVYDGASVLVDNCKNFNAPDSDGTVQATLAAGGIVGKINKAGATITSCENNMAVIGNRKGNNEKSGTAAQICALVADGVEVTLAKNTESGSAISNSIYYRIEADVTIDDNSSYKELAHLDIAAGVTVTLNGGEFGNVYIGEGAKLVIDGEVLVSGVITANSGSIEVKGDAQIQKKVVLNNSSILVTDGEFHDLIEGDTTSSATIKGGLYHFNIAYYDYLKPDSTNYAVEDNGNGTWYVIGVK